MTHSFITPLSVIEAEAEDARCQQVIKYVMTLVNGGSGSAFIWLPLLLTHPVQRSENTPPGSYKPLQAKQEQQLSPANGSISEVSSCRSVTAVIAVLLVFLYRSLCFCRARFVGVPAGSTKPTGGAGGGAGGGRETNMNQKQTHGNFHFFP